MRNHKSVNLYIHIPFCAQKCHYCAFYSSANSSELIEPYCNALIKELSTTNYSLSTVYIGGGTPSLLPSNTIAKIIKTLKASHRVNDNAEITIEANPDSITLSKLKEYRLSGINRISIGLQAWQNSHLMQMGRLHTLESFLAAFRNVREAGFSNVNIDLMFGLPGQSLQEWMTTIHEVINLQPEHISCYSLELDNSSMWGTLYTLNKLSIPTPAIDRKMFDIAIEALISAGYVHYELSNFCKPNFECQHNHNFWHHQEYVGIGAGAHSYVNKIHSHHQENIRMYLANPEEIVDQKNTLKQEQQEWLIKRFRLVKGFSPSEYVESFGLKLESDFKDQIDDLINQGLIIYSPECIQPTKKGLDLYNQLVLTLL